MNRALTTEHEAEPIAQPLRTALVQRSKCACGGASGLSGGCASCAGSAVATPKRNSISDSASGHSFGSVPVHRSRSAGKFSINISPASVPSSGQQTEASDEDPQEQTTTSATTSGNRIDVTFDPTTTSPTPHCSRLILTQWIRMVADGSSIMPGTYYTPWTCRDPTCLTDATYLDHGSCSYTTPYPVDRGIGRAGSSNGTAVSATYFDAPTTGGGDKGFNSSANPTGWNTVTYFFGNYAFCAEGTDCGTWYDGVLWNYTKTAADHAAGRAGTATATASAMPPRPGDTIIQAFDQYNSVKGFTPCMYSTAGP